MPDGSWAGGRGLWGLWYGKDSPANNSAETRTVQDVLTFLIEWDLPEWTRVVGVFGDSRLVANFCNRQAQPRKAELWVTMQEVYKLCQ